MAATSRSNTEFLGHRKIAFIRGPKTLGDVRRVGVACVTTPKRAAWNSFAVIVDLPESRRSSFQL